MARPDLVTVFAAWESPICALVLIVMLCLVAVISWLLKRQARALLNKSRELNAECTDMVNGETGE